MKVPGKTFVGALGFSLTLMSTVIVVAVLSGAPFAASAAMVDGFHAEMGTIQGENMSMEAVLGGLDTCQALMLSEIDHAEVSGFGVYRQVELPGGNVSVKMNIPAEANMSLTDVEMKMMALQSERMVATRGVRASEQYAPQMTMGRQEEFSLEIGRVEITNASARIYAISSGSMQIPLSVPQFDVDVNQAPPEDFPMTKCPEKMRTDIGPTEAPSPDSAGSGTRDDDRPSIGQGAISGQVVDADGDPIADATVRVPDPDEDRTTTTDDEGRYTIPSSTDESPDEVTVLVQKAGYASGSTIVSPGGSKDVELKPDDSSRVPITTELHHLGDGEYDGEINANFQKPIEGPELTREFRLSQIQNDVSGAELVYTIRGAELNNEVSLNGVVLAEASSAPADGTASDQRLRVRPEILRVGTNTLEVRADANRQRDLDDFEIANIRLVLDGVADSSDLDR